MVSRVCNVHRAIRAHRDSHRAIHFARGVAFRPPCRDKRTVTCKFLNSIIIGGSINYIHVAVAIRGHSERVIEFAVTGSAPAPRQYEFGNPLEFRQRDGEGAAGIGRECARSGNQRVTGTSNVDAEGTKGSHAGDRRDRGRPRQRATAGVRAERHRHRVRRPRYHVPESILDRHFDRRRDQASGKRVTRLYGKCQLCPYLFDLNRCRPVDSVGGCGNGDGPVRHASHQTGRADRRNALVGRGPGERLAGDRIAVRVAGAGGQLERLPEGDEGG